jgi:orotidine-5'-phosphate decarboxylase
LGGFGDQISATQKSRPNNKFPRKIWFEKSFWHYLSNSLECEKLEKMDFNTRLTKQIDEKKSCLMLGLDPVWEKIPAHLKGFSQENFSNEKKAEIIEQFCREILLASREFICGIKIQMAYFEIFGGAGIVAVENLLQLAKKYNLITMIDGKRGDIGTTSEAYAQAYLQNGSSLQADCTTVNPFLGSDGVLPFCQKAKENGQGIFVLLKTSNPSAQELQPLIIDKLIELAKEWQLAIDNFPGKNFSALGVVVGATNSQELKSLQQKLPQTWFLTPGVGAQGGDLSVVLKLRNEQKHGVIIPVSRSVLYADDGEDFAKSASDVLAEMYKLQV